METNNILRGLIAQLYISRAQVDSMLILGEEILKGMDVECHHPSNQRQDLTVMGGPVHWICGICKKEFIDGLEIIEE
jgi:hypothetical protein